MPTLTTPYGKLLATPYGHMPSVTTILKATNPKKMKYGNRTKAETDLLFCRGKLVDAMAANYLLTSGEPQVIPVDTPVSVAAEIPSYWEPLKAYLDTALPNLVSVYRPLVERKLEDAIAESDFSMSTQYEIDRVYSESLKFCGTPDWILDTRSTCQVWDLKTSGSAKKIYWLHEDWIQVCLYSLAWEEMTGKRVGELKLCVSMPGDCQTFCLTPPERITYEAEAVRRVGEFWEMVNNG